MMKPNRHSDARLVTVDTLMSQNNLCRATIVRIARESGAYFKIGKSVRVDKQKFEQGLNNYLEEA